MSVIDQITDEIKKNSRNGCFRNSWHLEGSIEEKHEFYKQLNKKLKHLSPEITLVRLRRYTSDYELLQLGEPDRAFMFTFLLTIEIKKIRGKHIYRERKPKKTK